MTLQEIREPAPAPRGGVTAARAMSNGKRQLDALLSKGASSDEDSPRDAAAAPKLGADAAASASNVILRALDECYRCLLALLGADTSCKRCLLKLRRRHGSCGNSSDVAGIAMVRCRMLVLQTLQLCSRVVATSSLVRVVCCVRSDPGCAWAALA
jgi:hypothetical protein